MLNQHQPSTGKRALLLLLVTAILLSAFVVGAQDATAEPATGEPIYIGVSGPVTGDLAQYGAQWKKGFDIAIQEINDAGGVDGRPLEYIFEDSQSDPKQSVVVAQKFVADDRIIVELGDFSSTASMAASAIYQRGGLVQFGFTNSHPDFTKSSDYSWSTSVTQDQASPALADFAVTTLGLKKLAVFQINNDWGKATDALFAPRVTELGAEIVASQEYLPDETDFRSALTTVKNAGADGIVLISYQPDGALIAQQAREAGLTIPFVGSASLQSPDFTDLGGDAVEGAFILGEFLTSDPRPEVQAFVEKFKATYDEEPDLFAALAYDTIYLIAEAIKVGGPTRQGVHDALPQLKDVPSVVYGTVTFDPETRRAKAPKFENLIVQDGAFVPWEATEEAPSS